MFEFGRYYGGIPDDEEFVILITRCTYPELLEHSRRWASKYVRLFHLPTFPDRIRYTNPQTGEVEVVRLDPCFQNPSSQIPFRFELEDLALISYEDMYPFPPLVRSRNR